MAVSLDQGGQLAYVHSRRTASPAIAESEISHFRNIHAEIIVRGKHINYKSEAETDDIHASFNLAYKKMKAQLSKEREKRKQHRGIHLADLEILYRFRHLYKAS